MTEYDALNNKTIKVHETNLKTYKKNDQLLVDKVYLHTEDHEIPNQKVSINPKIKETEVSTKVVNGTAYDTETESKRDPTIHELNGQFPLIDSIVDKVNEYGTIELTGMIRCVRDKPEDQWNMFIRASELSNFQAEVLEENDPEKTEKVEEDKEKERIF